MRAHSTRAAVSCVTCAVSGALVLALTGCGGLFSLVPDGGTGGGQAASGGGNAATGGGSTATGGGSAASGGGSAASGGGGAASGGGNVASGGGSTASGGGSVASGGGSTASGGGSPANCMTVYTQDIKVPSPAGGRFDSVGGLAFGPGGTLAVLSQPQSGAFVTLLAPDLSLLGTFGKPQLGLVRDVTIDDAGRVYVVEEPQTGAPSVKRFMPDGGYVGSWFANADGQTDGLSLAFDGEGLLNVGGSDGIHRYHPDGTAAGVYGMGGLGPGAISWAAGLAYDAHANRMWVGDMLQNYVEKYVPGQDTQLSQFGGRGSGAGQFDNGEPTGDTAYGPNRLAVDAQGRLYAADPFPSRLIKFSSSGAYLSQFSFGGAQWIGAVAIAPDGRIFVGIDGDVLIVCPF